jgi:AraC-like DNA-binding protein
VGRKTGRTVQQWITERRLTKARRLLVETDLTVDAIGARVALPRSELLHQELQAHSHAHPLRWRCADRA